MVNTLDTEINDRGSNLRKDFFYWAAMHVRCHTPKDLQNGYNCIIILAVMSFAGLGRAQTCEEESAHFELQLQVLGACPLVCQRRI